MSSGERTILIRLGNIGGRIDEQGLCYSGGFLSDVELFMSKKARAWRILPVMFPTYGDDNRPGEHQRGVVA